MTDKTEAPELKPCPFCKSVNVSAEGWMRNDGKTGPACDDCGGSADTVDLWNAAPRTDACAEVTGQNRQYRLAYAIAGGEDAPGLLDSISTDDLCNMIAKERAEHRDWEEFVRKQSHAAGYAQALEDAIEWLHENFSWSENEMTFHDMADDIRALNKEAGA